jgi:transposase
MKKLEGLKNKPGKRFQHDMAFMRAVIREYETSDLSTAQIGLKYGLAANQVTRWRKRFSSDLSEEKSLTPDLPMNPEEQKQLDALKKQNEALLKKLELANLKITGLETMIDIAEQELHLDIRKKPGTKQSND